MIHRWAASKLQIAGTLADVGFWPWWKPAGQEPNEALLCDSLHHSEPIQSILENKFVIFTAGSLQEVDFSYETRPPPPCLVLKVHPALQRSMFEARSGPLIVQGRAEI